MVYVIAFKDGEDLHYWREEKYDDNGSLIDYGEIKTFENKEKCDEFRINVTDSRCFDFYTTEITEEELKKENEKFKDGYEGEKINGYK